MNSRHSLYPTTTILAAKKFQQLPGESDIDFIKRITSESKAMMENNSYQEEEVEEKPKPKGTYQRIEDWDAQRKASGEMSWEERVMFEGQRHGNQVRQNDILLRNLHSF